MSVADYYSRRTYPPSKRLVGVAIWDGKTWVDHGDIASAVPKWWESPRMRRASAAIIAGVRHIDVQSLKQWVHELERADRKDQAAALTRLIGWAEMVAANLRLRGHE